jgi:polysaccharide chain length determinant protein (PEP-CTERM system associated)
MNETLEQVRRVLREMWHRRWIGLGVAWVVALVAIAIAYRIPERYEATARVFVDTESLLKPLLAGLAVQPNVDQQVSLVSRTLISRPNVEKVVRMADLDLRARSDADREELVDRVMKTIRLTGSTSNNLYTISYLDTEPEQARKTVQSLLTIFVESSLGDKRQDSRAAVRFIDDQIKHYERTLQAAENRLKEFKLRYMGLTEGDGGGDYFGRMGAIQGQIAAARLELTAAEQARDSYKRELAGEQPAFIPERVEVAGPPDSVPEIDVRLAQLKRELDELSRRFTEKHPDVANTQRVIAELEAQRKVELAERRKTFESAAAGRPGGPVDRNPVFQQLRISLAEAEAQLASSRAKLAGLEGQYAQLKSRAKMVPEVEAEYAQLNRDYEVQKKTYESLLSRRESATMGIGMQDTGGAQFRVIDPPRVSPRPVAPNRLALLGLAFLASIAAGLAAAFVASQVAPTFHEPATLRKTTNRPVLGSVSMLPSPGLVAARRRRGLYFAGGLSGLLALFATVAAFALFLWRAAA